ncbi:MAG: hypothetical protein M1819_005553 [Sarea resinae]|nr:MAG: hypothetical protein M1819_005553 [Sarea resinae]
MKPPNTNATANAAAASSSNRRQPVRQARTNPSRASAASRSFSGRASLSGAPDTAHNTNSAPGFFPAITHFTDSITALPKEIIRHFTLLKEVDAKACGPEETLGQLVEAALKMPAPPRKPQPSSELQITNAADSQTGSGVASPTVNGGHPFQQAVAGPSQAFDENADLARRQLFLNLRYLVSEMLMTLDEKNHVISTATEALSRQLARVDSSFPYIDNEVSEEAQKGSLMHWAYADKLAAIASGANNEKSRRDVAATNSLAAAAAAVHDGEAASRSESRREAMRNKKHHHDSDVDDRHREGASHHKKTPGTTKVRKAAEAAAAADGKALGLGISHGAPAPPTKRRKTEKAANGAAATERPSAGALGQVGGKGGAGSPRETQGAEGPKKRAKAPAGTRKRNNTNASGGQSPSLASSPVHSTFAAAKAFSPAPGAGPGQRPQSSRARQNSTHSIQQDAGVATARNRPSPAASNKPTSSHATGTANTPDMNSVAGLTGRSVADVKSSMKESVTAKGEHLIEEPAGNGNPGEPELKGALLVGNSGSDSGKKPKTPEDSSLKVEDAESAVDAMPGVEHTGAAAPPPSQPQPASARNASGTNNTTSGKNSKTSTPTTASFPVADPPLPAPRARSSRASETSTSNNTTTAAPTAKRSHKKGAGAVAAAAAAAAAAAHQTGSGTTATHSNAGDENNNNSTSSKSTSLTTADTADSPPITTTTTRSHHTSSSHHGSNNNKGEDVVSSGVGTGGGGSGGGVVGVGVSDNENENEDEDDSEPRYCYCNQVSYGEMVACDADDCPREWFHLSCVGLSKAPTKNAKWYCDECKESLKRGRLGSSHAASASASASAGGGR